MNSAAREELTRQTIILVFSLVGFGVIYLAQDPDALREFRMMVSLKVKRVAQKVADRVQKVADDAASAYQREQP